MKRAGPSIAVVLILALVAMVTLLLALFAVAVYRDESHARREQLRSKVSVTADQQAAALTTPMWNLDETHIAAILRSAMSDREIYAMSATTQTRPYRLVRDAGWNVVASTGEPSPDGLLVQDRDVTYGREVVGHVRVYASPRFLQEDLASRQRSIVLFIVLLDAGIVASLSLLLWQVVLRPIRSVEQLASSVKDQRTAAAPRAPAWFHGELKDLDQSIRDMIDMLDRRYLALHESEERLKLATRAADVGIWDWDVVRDVLVWDDRMLQIYGLRRDEFSGHVAAWRNVLVDGEEALRQIESALRGEAGFESEFRIRRPDGSVRTLRGEATTLRDDSGRAVRMVGVNFDITDAKLAEEQVRRLNAELESRVAERTSQLQSAMAELSQARDAAESATRAKSEFLANMSHEIRTPMNAILGMVRLALRTELDERQRGYILKARSAADSLLGIIDDILDFSRIEAGRLVMESSRFSLAEVLDRVVSVVGVKAQEKGLDLRIEVAPDVPPELVGDSLRLGQVLINLGGNAAKFTAHGRVVVSVAVQELRGEKAQLRFTVSDTGVGMSAGQLRELFQPFNQLDASTTRRYGGTGLGLVISKNLVERMGGQIGAASVPGQGSEFSFTAEFGLPQAAAACADSGRASAPAAAVEGEAPAVLRGRRVLLVEDNEFNRIVASELLADAAGMQIDVVGDGQEAVERAAAESFDAVLMDVQMPGMDGYQATALIRSDPANASLPIIAMTAHAMARDRVNCLAAGMDDFISKPFEPEELFQVLAKWIGRDGIPPSQGSAWKEEAQGPAQAPVSFRLGLQRCLGRADLYERILGRFLASHGEAAAQIRSALEQGRPLEAAAIAHSMVSTAGTLGAERLSQAARELQLAIDGDDSSQWPRLLADFAREHALATAAAARYFEGSADPEPRSVHEAA